jgi:hypothetical protein
LREGGDLSSQILTETVEASSNESASVETVVLLRKLDENTRIIVIRVIHTNSAYVPVGSAILPPILSECRAVEGVGRFVNALASLKTHPHVRIYHTVVRLIPNRTLRKKCTDNTLICPERA